MLGLGLTNHSGVHGVLLNPARLANHPQRFSVSLVTAGTHLDNSFGIYQAPFPLAKLAIGQVPTEFQTKGEIDFLPEYVTEISGEGLRSGTLSADVRGPSVLFTPRYGGGFSISTRIRSAFQFSNASPEFLSLVRTGLDNPTLWNAGTSFDQKFAINANTYGEAALAYGREVWSKGKHYGEAALAYGREVWSKGKHYVSAGLSVKYLTSWYSSHLIADNLKYRITKTAGGGSGQIQIDQLSGTLGYVAGQSLTENIRSGKFPEQRPGSGFGADLGLIYEFRPYYARTNT